MGNRHDINKGPHKNNISKLLRKVSIVMVVNVGIVVMQMVVKVVKVVIVVIELQTLWMNECS
jgi:hypothetical protein